MKKELNNPSLADALRGSRLQKVARVVLKHCPHGNFWTLAGPSNKEARREVMQAIRMHAVNLCECGINAIMKELMVLYAVPEACQAEMENVLFARISNAA